MILVLFAALFLSASDAPIGPESGLRKTTKCYLAESKRLAASRLSEREIDSRVVEICQDEIDLAASELFAESETSRLKLVVAVKDQVITQVRTIRSMKKTKLR